MKYLLHNSIIPYLKQKFQLKSRIIKATVLHAATMGESVIDEKICDLELLPNPTVGLLAHPGQVDIRITVKAESESEALALLQPLVIEIKSRLGDNIYGQDEETLESIIGKRLNLHKMKLCVGEFGLDGSLINRLRLGQPDYFHGVILANQPEDPQELAIAIKEIATSNPCDVLLGIALIIHSNITAIFYYHDHLHSQVLTRIYRGPEENALLWAQNISLDFLRRQLTIYKGN
jgi:hypothetical protein